MWYFKVFKSIKTRLAVIEELKYRELLWESMTLL